MKNFIAFCLLLIIAGCYTPRYVYSPPAQNVATLTQKGESKLAILYSTNMGSNNDVEQHGNAYSSGIDIHTAYAISNHIISQFNFYYRSEQNSNDNSNNTSPEIIRYKRNLCEFAFGYFTAMNASKKSYFYILGGAGMGNFRFKDYGFNGNATYFRNFHEAPVFKFSIQPALFYKLGKRFSQSFASKFSFLDFKNIKTSYNDQELDLYKLKDLEKGLVSFWEPALVLNYHFKKLPYLQLEGQIGASFLLNQKFVDTRTFNASIGVSADIARWILRKPEQKK